ncbi:hypothetical protein [Bradyrhizobium sp. Ec3.3]|uniref:hypothetical protein n=1 Tax=Bradyrhizobium sp. Ec3.3 TaxID=189753 RepID=UPI0012EB3132|nr:hypothetical protein [Bradyrhizobium sp. Ec3.3]
MTKVTAPSSGASHDINNESKVANKPGGSGSNVNAPGIGSAASGAGAVLDSVGSAATFEALIAQLKAVNQQAMVQDMRLRALSTELSSEKKAASERASG